MKLIVRDGHTVDCVSDVKKSVVIVLVVVTVAGEVAMVDPDVGRFLQRDCVSIVGHHFLFTEHMSKTELDVHMW